MSERHRERVGREGQTILSEVLGDRYAMVDKLGSGAFGEVYRAEDRVLGRQVAIKRIRLDVFPDSDQLEELQQRFVHEAQVAAKLRHPNIVTTHDIVLTPTITFIVMELIAGETLHRRLSRTGRLSVAEIVDVLRQVASAIDYAHQHHVIHRDIKPANIMIEPSGHVKVMDFGIAKLDSGTDVIATGSIVGTPNYMSPEHARGQTLDGRSDIFSLGCILYECLSGTKAFRGDSLTAILMKVLNEDPPPVDYDAIGLPVAVGDVVRRALEKSPRDRYPSGAALIADLQKVLGDAVAVAEPPVAKPIPATTSTAPSPKHAAVKLGTAAAVIAVAMLVAWGIGAFSTETPEVPRPTESGSEALVVEEELGFFSKLLGREPRVFITVPAETELALELLSSLSSETAAPGDRFETRLRSAVAIEGIEAIPAGSVVAGHVSHAESAASAGRGELTLDFDSVELADGTRVAIEAKPVSLKAPAPPEKDGGLIGEGVAGVRSLVGRVFGRKTSGTEAEDVAEAQLVLAEGASVNAELSAPISITRSKDSDP